MGISRKWIGAVALAVAIGVSARAEATTEILFGHVGEPGSLFAESAEEYALRANERLAEAGLDYEVRVFGSSQLGADGELLQRLRAGTVDLALPSTIMSSVVDEFGLFELPYLVRDREHMKRIEAEIFWPDLEPLVQAAGYRTLAVWENGFRHITNNVRPIVVPEDLQGLRLRTPRGAWRVRMFETYGASPSPMEFSEVFMALQTGVMDGQENPFAQIASARFQEAQAYLSLSNHVYTPAYVLTGAGKWGTFPEEVRALLEEVARDTQDYVYETAAAMEDELLEVLAASMEVNEVDTDAFIAASQPVYDAFAEEVPGADELISRALALGEAS